MRRKVFTILFIVCVVMTQVSLGHNQMQVQDIKERFHWINLESLELAIQDLEQHSQFDKNSAKQKLAYIKNNYQRVQKALEAEQIEEEILEDARVILRKQYDILTENPLLDMDKIVFTRFKLDGDARSAWANKMCMPFSNYMGLIDVPPTGYNTELSELSELKNDIPKVRTIYKPKHGEGIADVQLHWDADRLLFASSKPVVLDAFYNQEYPSWHIFEIGLDGKNLKTITDFAEPDLEFADPCYLPDGRVLLTTNIGYNGIPCEHGERVIMNLAILDRNKKQMRKITFDQDGNWSPTVLNDGRVMYTRWEYTDLTHYFSRIVMQSNPDGTGARALYGSGSYWPTSVYDMQQLPNAGNQFIGIVSGHHGVPRSGRLIVFDPNKGRKEADGVVQEIPYRNRKVEPVIKDRLVDGVFPQFSRPFPLNDKYFLVTAKLHPKGLWGVYLVDVFDNMTLLYEKEDEGVLTPIPVVKRPIPPIIPDAINKKSKEATVFIQDIYEGEGLRDVPRGVVKKLRLFTYEYAYLKSPSDFDALGVQSGWDLKRELGEVEVEEDGSAIFTVPANTPISIQPLDAEGHAIQWMRSWFTAMPGEFVSCIGCHEDQNQIPIPKKVIAASTKPHKITPPQGGTRPFSFELEIQPLLNKYCISCHNGENNSIDLSGRTKTEYKRWGNYTTHRFMNDSYYAIHPYLYRQGPEADMYVLEPYEYHASNSELIQMINNGHHGVKMEHVDMTTLCKWIDFNAPYFGDFEIAGRYKATFEQYPRRQQLMQKYANVHTDWKGELIAYAKYLKNKGEEKPITPKKRKDTRGEKVLTFSPEVARHIQTEEKNNPIKTIQVNNKLAISFTWIPSSKGVEKRKSKSVNGGIEKGFWMGTTEVTNAQFTQLFPDHDSRYIGQQWKDHTTPGYPANEPHQPVVRVSWREAMEFCKKLSEQTGLKITLPSQEQWMWACRAGSSESMWYGDPKQDYSNFENMADFTIKDLAVYGLEPTVPMPDNFPSRKFWDFVPRDSFANDKALISTKVARYQPNYWGVYDIHGNVAEWTSTLSDEVSIDGEKRIVCGGSWRDRAKQSSVHQRRHFHPWQKPFNVGFRLIIEE